MLHCVQEENMEFAEKLKTLRKDADLTQQEVADKLYISRSLYAKYESGIAVPNKDTLQKIALLFNVDVNELISYEETTFMAVEEHNTREKLKNPSTLSLFSKSIVINIPLQWGNNQKE